MPVSTAMYAIEGGFDAENLLSQLSEVELERQPEKVNEPLRTKFNAVSKTTNGVTCAIQFEVETRRSGWNGAEYRKESQQARIRFTDSIGDGGVLVVANADDQTKVASRLLDFFGVGPTPQDSRSIGLVRVEISEPELRSILNDDADIESRATYDSIDENTSSASLAGALGESGTARDLDNKGDKRWVIFESKSFEKKVGITVKNNAVVFWGDWDDAEMERYWNRIVLPNLD